MKNLKKEFRKYNAVDTLFEISKTIISLFNNKEPFYYKPMYRRFAGKIINIGEQLITPWELTAIAFYIIMYSNDYRGKIPNEQGFEMLINSYGIAHETRTLKNMEDTSIHDQLHGLSQLQFWYQDKGELLNNINREIEILLFCNDVSNKLTNSDLDKIIEAEFGFNLQWFYILTFSVFASAIKNSDLTTININEDLLKGNKEFNISNFEKIIEFYSIDYAGIKESKFSVDQLSIKPIVKTNNGRRIAINVFLLARKCSEGPYWFLRDHFEQNRSQDFLNEYGNYYEKYFEKLLAKYLDKKSYSKLKTNNKKKIADWVIYIDEFVIIIEQKSSLLPINAKTEFPDSKVLDKYLDKYRKAFIQLNSTLDQLEDLEEKIVLKFTVHYEKLYLSSFMRDKLISKINDEHLDPTNFFLVNINEIERLIYSISKNVLITKQILKEFISSYTSEPSNRSDLSFFLNKYEIENDYLLTKINHLHDWTKEGTVCFDKI